MRVFPLRAIKGAYVIALNQAWKYFKDPDFQPKLAVTVHPELYQEWAKLPAVGPHRRTQWAVKRKPPMGDLDPDHPEIYVFKTSPDPDTVVARPDDTLHIGEGVQ